MTTTAVILRNSVNKQLSSLQTCPSLITKVGEQLADYFPCGGFVVTDQGEKGISSKWGFQVLKREYFVMGWVNFWDVDFSHHAMR